MDIKKIRSSVYAKFKDYIGLLIGLVILCVLFSVLSPSFLKSKNIMNVLRQIATNAIMAYGMTFVLLQGGIDLSMGSMVSFASIFSATFIGILGVPVWLTVILCLIAGAILGIFNGFVINKTGLWPFIVTLATSLIIGGAAYAISGGTPVRVLNETFNKIGTGYIGPIALPIVYMFVLLVISYIILQKTKFGRHVYAIGGNPEAARFSGINSMKVSIMCYMIAGVLASFTGVFLTARMYTGQPTLGSTMVNDAIASTVVGGTSMAGGKGRIVGTLVGAVLIGVISNGMNLLGMSSYLQDIAKGIIILVAVYIDSVSTKKLARAPK